MDGYTRHDRRNQEAEHKRAVWAGWTGPTHRVSDLVPDDARINRPIPNRPEDP